jgi:general secretion pathway protein A
MYAAHFGLTQEPFSIAPDPRFLFMSEQHREALAHLLFGLGGGGGFVLLTGEIGAGKTTVCRCFLEQIPKRCNVAYIFNPKLTVTELLRTVCDEFSIPYPARDPGRETVKEYIDPLNEFLLRTHAVGQDNLLIIDEAQNLSSDVLEQLRLLTNLETGERKLLQIVLIGQPQLRAQLARRDMQNLAQRVIARFHIDALNETETRRYIRHRLSVAGFDGRLPFNREAVKRVHRWSRGIPRRINLLADRALLGAYSANLPRVDARIVDKAASEVFDTDVSGRLAAWQQTPSAGITIGLVATAIFSALAVWLSQSSGTSGPSGGASAAALSPKAAVAADTGPSGAGTLVATGSGSGSGSASAAAAAPQTDAGSASPGGHGAEASSDVGEAEALATILASAAGEEQAWRELASMWSVPAEGGPLCEEVPWQTVRCYRSERGLDVIRELGRPGLIQLRVGEGRNAYALLVALNDKAATLRAGGIERSLPLAALSLVWRGDFATLWRIPPGYKGLVAGGQAGPVVDQLAQQLATWRKEPPPAASAAFDDALRTKLMAFQQAKGLKPDGIAGPTTFMMLNRSSGVDEPRLGQPG